MQFLQIDTRHHISTDSYRSIIDQIDSGLSKWELPYPWELTDTPLQDTIDDLKSELESVKDDYSDLEHKHDNLIDELDDAKDEIAEWKEKYYSVKQQLDEYESQL